MKWELLTDIFIVRGESQWVHKKTIAHALLSLLLHTAKWLPGSQQLEKQINTFIQSLNHVAGESWTLATLQVLALCWLEFTPDYPFKIWEKKKSNNNTPDFHLFWTVELKKNPLLTLWDPKWEVALIIKVIFSLWERNVTLFWTGEEHLMLFYFTEWNKCLWCKWTGPYAEIMKKKKPKKNRF